MNPLWITILQCFLALALVMGWHPCAAPNRLPWQQHSGTLPK